MLRSPALSLYEDLIQGGFSQAMDEICRRNKGGTVAQKPHIVKIKGFQEPCFLLTDHPVVLLRGIHGQLKVIQILVLKWPQAL